MSTAATATAGSSSAYKARQYAHLQSQLAQLQANLSDMEELLRMTATQAENIKILGGLQGGLFIGATKVFEESENQRREQADPHANSLSSLIPRIQNERGPFKNVSEEGLKEEITAAEKQQQDREEAQDEDARDSAQDDDDQANASTDEQPNPRETLAFKRQELIKLVEQAQFEAMYALDFVSLLLSNIRPVHAEASMSRHLRENVASGTLGAEPIRPKELAASLKDDNDTISKGWMSEALAQSASSLLSAASRLAQESEREATYWEDVLDVKKEGWAICRVPREPQSLGVRFGFWEAGADEKYRGLGILRKGSDGTITMQDLGYGTANHNSVRVRISRRGKITGISKPFADDSQTSGITSMIQTARNYAYEHELFLEIAREARALANLGFRNTDEAITFELGPGVSVVIDTRKGFQWPYTCFCLMLTGRI
ncbi:hypothetical protein DRE_06955 [Drechslerella stenobrocha 248]|uniref:Mediator of RNA polymerase II transcription subunit 17 n=1 Tax=Drechslerella stenobrocha 248 TaxID=1043628 RepID=W7I638_9PEZI|nr:hypothetical protein DRE_06955 [Drechslerella stenobrocha 248]